MAQKAAAREATAAHTAEIGAQWWAISKVRDSVLEWGTVSVQHLVAELVPVQHLVAELVPVQHLVAELVPVQHLVAELVPVQHLVAELVPGQGRTLRALVERMDQAPARAEPCPAAACAERAAVAPVAARLRCAGIVYELLPR
jgi:hypothetical protein